MTMEPTPALRLNQLLASARLPEVNQKLAGRFQAYLELLMRWNARVNLTAIRDEEGIRSRHFVESIACAHALPAGIKTLLDFGSGAGFPGIPIALCRPEISVTLAESQSKKAAFLQEALRTLGLQAAVYAGRAEMIGATFDCVTMRAVDRMETAVQAASSLVSPGGWLATMVTGTDLATIQLAAGDKFTWEPPSPLPSSNDRHLALARKTG